MKPYIGATGFVTYEQILQQDLAATQARLYRAVQVLRECRDVIEHVDDEFMPDVNKDDIADRIDAVLKENE